MRVVRSVGTSFPPECPPSFPCLCCLATPFLLLPFAPHPLSVILKAADSAFSHGTSERRVCVCRMWRRPLWRWLRAQNGKRRWGWWVQFTHVMFENVRQTEGEIGTGWLWLSQPWRLYQGKTKFIMISSSENPVHSSWHMFVEDWQKWNWMNQKHADTNKMNFFSWQ